MSEIAAIKRFTNNKKYDEKPITNFHEIGPETDLTQLNLNWSEQDLPERVRTKHVHRLHPYLGKFIPQIAEILLRKFQPKRVLDPFGGSGTTSVEALSIGIDSIYIDISAFNTLLTKVKTYKYDIETLKKEGKDIIEKFISFTEDNIFNDRIEKPRTDSEYLNTWFSRNALDELLTYRNLIHNYRYQDVFKVILSRAARSARLVPHHNLDNAKKPQKEPYECRKHKRICYPVNEAKKFLIRYTQDTIERITFFSKIRKDNEVLLFNDDARTIDLPEFDLVITSPPYVGLINYHEQHAYAYELLKLPRRDNLEIGPAFKGNAERAKDEYINKINEVWLNIRKSMTAGGKLLIVINDKHNLYKAGDVGFVEELRFSRHVNRRTGRRNGDFFEDILVWKA